MSRIKLTAMVGAATAIALALSLAACATGGHPSAAHTAGPHPAAPHASDRATPRASASATPVPVARLSTEPGDELLTFSGTGRSTDGSSVAISFTLHAPVAWNSAAGTSTLAALSAGGSAQAAIPAQDLRDTTWDAAKAVSLAVVDYSATMVSGRWRPGERVEIDLGHGSSEVAATSTGLAVENGWWLLTGPGSGHFVVAFENDPSSTPDPSKWANGLEIYGLGDPQVSGTAASYQFQNCRMDLTTLGRGAEGVSDWFMPTASYCFAGIGD